MLLRNKLLIFAILILLASPMAMAEDICLVEDVLQCLKGSLYAFLTEDASALELPPLLDLIKFYLGPDCSGGTADCSVKVEDSESNKTITEIMDDIGGQCSFGPTCVDGTQYLECSSVLPSKYCFFGELTTNCKECGCPDNTDPPGGKLLCEENECVTPPTTIACNADLDCGIDSFVGDKSCSENSRYQDYTTFNCIYPSTSDADCEDESTSNLIGTCEFACADGECVPVEDIFYIPAGVCPALPLNLQDTYYRLSGDLLASGDCIIIEADGITLDLGGYTMFGDGTGVGITVQFWDYILIKDGTVTNFVTPFNIQSLTTVVDNVATP